jgi:hypothetical protein
MKIREIIVGVEFYEAPLCPAGHLPLKGGDWLAAPSADLPAASEIGEIAYDFQSPPFEGEMSGRTEGALMRDVSFGRRASPTPP